MVIMYFKSLKILNFFFISTISFILCATCVDSETNTNNISVSNDKLELPNHTHVLKEKAYLGESSHNNHDPIQETGIGASEEGESLMPKKVTTQKNSDKEEKKKVTQEGTIKEDGQQTLSDNLKGIVEETPTLVQKEKVSHRPDGILVVSLGAGEDEVLASHLTWLFVHYGHPVTVLLYGDGPREELFPDEAKIINIEAASDDPLRPDGKSVVGLTPEDISSGEWMTGKVVWSRLCACRRLMEVETALEALDLKVMVTPLFLHDVCVLSLANRLKIPVVGILTSRIGAWWTWAQLGVLPSLSSVPVPLSSMGDGGVWSRAANLASHYGYMSSLRQQWQVKAVNALPSSWNQLPLVELYGNVRRLLLAWDPLVDPHVVPVPSAIPIGGFAATFSGNIEKDILVPALLNRAGVVVVSAGTRESWIGQKGIQLLSVALRATSFTILWKTSHPHLRPQNSSDVEKSTARFIFKDKIPLNEVLRHSRHRFMISTCGEIEVMAAVFFGSPVLCLPVTMDQMLASQELKRLGVAEMLLASDITQETLQIAIERLSTERSFRLRARELAEDLHDQPTTPSERLIFHVENVMRRPDSVRYKIFGSRLPLLQQTNADVYLVIIVLLFVCTSVIVVACIQLYPIFKKGTKVKDD